MNDHLDPRRLMKFAVTASLLLGACGARPGDTELEKSFR